MSANYKSIVLAIGFFFALSTSISAAPGELDLTFGSGGIVITKGNNPNLLDAASAMAIQSDGKIVVVGDGYLGTFNRDFTVVRYNPDGSLDSSFGGTGIVITPVGNSHDQATSVAIQADGKIVVAGIICNGVGACGIVPGNNSFAVVRYNPNGSLDTSFNGTGKVITSVANSRDRANSVAIQADGKIVVAGSSQNGSNDDFALVRYNADGSLDTTFNGTGKVVTPVGGVNFAGGAYSLAIQSDGKIIAAGRSYLGIGGNRFAVVRYNMDGSLDTSFNGTGKVFTSVGNSDSGASELAIQTDGKIVVAGYSQRVTGDFGRLDFALVRYNPNGSLDTTFNGTGEIIIPIGNSDDYANSLAIQSDGKIVAAGTSRNNNGLYYIFAVVRFNPNGSLDTTFNGTGKVTTAFGGQDYAAAAAIQADGKIVVAGGTDDTDDEVDSYDFMVVRYQGDGATPTPACSNPIDCADFFVRQHYLDFLNREPDQTGLDYWTNQITQCVNDTRCIHERRIGVSAAFFVEQEFQQTGYFVYRLQQASFGSRPTFAQFTADRAQVVEGPNLEAGKQALAEGWVERAAFKTAFAVTMSPEEFVNKLFDTAGLRPFTAERQQLASDMRNGKSRARVLREVIELAEFRAREYNAAFVLMQYFGYLRRDPDQGGYDFWMELLNNRELNNYRSMVCAFLTSAEYQLRFGTAVTRTNRDCAQ